MTPRKRSAGVEPTEKQARHWIRRGWVYQDDPGIGRGRTWLPGEWQIACVMARLVQAGVVPVVAADAARAYVALGAAESELAPGVVLRIEVVS
jgi:hypothetical protein